VALPVGDRRALAVEASLRKRRNVIPFAGRYSPPRTRKNIGTSSAHSA
jgi:hypothetical protein